MELFEQNLKHSEEMRRARGVYLKDLSMEPKIIFDAWEPEYDCSIQRRIGAFFGDGGKWVCSPDIIPGPSDLIYSFGSNFDLSFEQDVRQYMPSIEMHTFDPTCPQTDKRWPAFAETLQETKVLFHAKGLRGGKENGVSKNSSMDLETFPALVQQLGHQGRRIRIFKIDCEGCEYEAFKSIFPMVSRGEIVIDQIQIEMHAAYTGAGRFMLIKEWFQSAEDAGYYIFHKERNHLGGCDGFRCVEFSLIHKSFALESNSHYSCPELQSLE